MFLSSQVSLVHQETLLISRVKQYITSFIRHSSNSAIKHIKKAIIWSLILMGKYFLVATRLMFERKFTSYQHIWHRQFVLHIWHSTYILSVKFTCSILRLTTSDYCEWRISMMIILALERTNCIDLITWRTKQMNVLMHKDQTRNDCSALIFSPNGKKKTHTHAHN